MLHELWNRCSTCDLKCEYYGKSKKNILLLSAKLSCWRGFVDNFMINTSAAEQFQQVLKSVCLDCSSSSSRGGLARKAEERLNHHCCEAERFSGHRARLMWTGQHTLPSSLGPTIWFRNPSPKHDRLPLQFWSVIVSLDGPNKEDICPHNKTGMTFYYLRASPSPVCCL